MISRSSTVVVVRLIIIMLVIIIMHCRRRCRSEGSRSRGRPRLRWGWGWGWEQAAAQRALTLIISRPSHRARCALCMVARCRMGILILRRIIRLRRLLLLEVVLGVRERVVVVVW